MSHYDALVGESFSRQGRTFTIVECDDDSVVGSARDGDGVMRVRVSVAEALASLEVPEITLTDVPAPRQERRAVRGA